MIGLGTGISSVVEFNRRAFVALLGVAFSGQIAHKEFIVLSRLKYESHCTLSPEQQQRLYQIVRSYRHQITDQLVIDYATDHTKGYSA